METVAQAQKQFDHLQAEKQQVGSHDMHVTIVSAIHEPMSPLQLESALSRVPVSGRVTLQNRQHQVSASLGSEDIDCTSNPLPHS